MVDVTAFLKIYNEMLYQQTDRDLAHCPLLLPQCICCWILHFCNTENFQVNFGPLLKTNRFTHQGALFNELFVYTQKLCIICIGWFRLAANRKRC